MKKSRITLVLLFLAGAFMACTSPTIEEQPKPNPYPNPTESTIYEQFQNCYYKSTENKEETLPCMIGECLECGKREILTQVHFFFSIDTPISLGGGYSWIDSVYGNISIHPTFTTGVGGEWIVDPNNNPHDHFLPLHEQSPMRDKYTHHGYYHFSLDIEEMKKVGGAAFRPYFYDSTTGKYYMGDICELEYRESADSANGFEIYIKHDSAN